MITVQEAHRRLRLAIDAQYDGLAEEVFGDFVKILGTDDTFAFVLSDDKVWQIDEQGNITLSESKRMH